MGQNSGFTVWLTGMSGTGKSTLANYLAARLRQVGRNVEVLDESDVAGNLWKGLGESKEERNEVVRRLGYVANLLTRNQVATLVAAVSPYKAAREENRKVVGRYLEVYVDCPTEKLIERDSTGKYKKALAGEIPNFIGITEPYEPPSAPEVTIHSDAELVEGGALRIFQALLDLGLVTPEELRVITGKRMKKGGSPESAKKARGRGKAGKKASKGAKARPSARAARVAKPAKKRKR